MVMATDEPSLVVEAQQLGSAVSAVCEDRGMASVMLQYDPYEGIWLASCSWSDDSRVECQHESSLEAIKQLKQALTFEHQDCLAEWRASN